MLKMYATLDGKLNGMNFEEFKKSGQELYFGGFCFKCMINGEDKSVSFDWDSFIANTQEDGTLLLEEGTKTFFDGSEELDDVYDYEYERNGFSRDDITANVLAATTEIEEFTIDYDAKEKLSDDDYLHIISIVFEDETGYYFVSGEVLDRFNQMEIYEPIRAEGDLETYDEFDGNYPDESDLSYMINNTKYEDMEELPF